MPDAGGWRTTSRITRPSCTRIAPRATVSRPTSFACCCTAFQELLLYGTQLQQAYFNTLQQRLLKVGARVVERGTVIHFHLPSSFPLQEIYRLIDRRLHPAPM